MNVPKAGKIISKGPESDEEKATLTIGLDHLGPARAAEDHDASTLLHGDLGVLVILFAVRNVKARWRDCQRLTVY